MYILERKYFQRAEKSAKISTPFSFYIFQKKLFTLFHRLVSASKLIRKLMINTKHFPFLLPNGKTKISVTILWILSTQTLRKFPPKTKSIFKHDQEKISFSLVSHGESSFNREI